MNLGVRPSCVICAWRGSCQKKYGIVDPASCADFSLDVSIKDMPDKKGVKLLIEGLPGSGKTTLVERAITRLGDCIGMGGFYTREIRKGGERVGFRIITVDKLEAVLAHVDQTGNIKVGRYTVNPEGIETVAVPAIERALRDDQLVIIDEIGKMEITSRHFCELVEMVLDGGCPVLATVPADGPEFIERIKSRADVRLLRIDQSNRDMLLDEVDGIIRGG